MKEKNSKAIVPVWGIMALKYFAIGLLVFVQYGQTVDFDYAFDDSIVITKNSKVQEGLRNPTSFFQNSRTGKLESNTGYRPIALLSFAADVHFYGLDPSKAHRNNAVLYALLCMLLLTLLELIFAQYKVWVFLATVLFTVHPLHVEVVANIKSRDELLATFFGLNYLYLHLRFFKVGNYGYLLVAPIVLLLSSMSKENGITFAGISLGLIFFAESATRRQKIFSAMASVASLASVLAMRLYVYSSAFFVNQQTMLEGQGRYHWDEFLGNPLFDVPEMGVRLANSFNIIYHSIRLFLVPYPLVHDYSYNHFPVVDWGSPQVYVGLFIVMASAVVIYRARWRSSMLAIGSMWFFVTLSIFLSLVRPATDIFAERFMFSPSIGLCVFSIGALASLGIDRKKLAVVVGMFSFALLVVSYQRCPAWKNTRTLLETDISKLKDCVRTNYNYGLLLHQEYDKYPEKRKAGDEERILKHYNLALDQSDRLANLYTALGNAYFRFNQPENGLLIFREAAQKYPDLAKPLVQIGGYYALQSQFDSAEFYFERALRIGKLNPELYEKLALAQYNAGKLSDAKQTMVNGENYSESVEYYKKFIVICVKDKDFVLAEDVCGRGLEKFPNDPVLLNYERQFLNRRKFYQASPTN